MKIQTSLDWGKVGIELSRQISELPYNPDLRKLNHNIAMLVSDLSKFEVEARRYKKYTLRAEEQLRIINEAIDRLEKLILVAMLMK